MTESYIEAGPELGDLRKFGYVMAVFFALVFGIFVPWWWSLKWAYWPWLLALFFLTLAIIKPSALGVFYKYWMRLGRVLEWVNVRIVLGIVFFLVFMPLGLLMRIFGRDTLQKKWDKQVTTYRVNRVNRKENHMERQF